MEQWRLRKGGGFAAARPEVPVIMISDFEGYASRRAKELTAGNQRPMMAPCNRPDLFVG